jgi:hypothetical protein
MNDQAPEPNVEELQQTAQQARDALLSSVSRLEDRVKSIKSQAADATAASGWGIAAGLAWWLSVAVHRPRGLLLPKHGTYSSRTAHTHKPSLAVVVITTAFKTAGLVLTGVLLYSSYRRARRLNFATPANPLALPSSRARASEALF